MIGHVLLLNINRKSSMGSAFFGTITFLGVTIGSSNTIMITDKLSRYYHDSSFEENLKKQELVLIPIAL